ncbi:MAG: cyclase [Frankiales bacterium]|nr:cyclase [Frankiales bacterium]
MSRLTTSTIVIDAPVAAVYEVISDVAGYPDWISQLKSAEVLERDADGRPSQVRFSIDAGMFSDNLVVAYEWSPTGAQWHLVSGTKVREQTGGYRLSAVDAGTSVEYDLRLDVDMPMFSLLRGQAERMLTDAALTSLKKRVETPQGDKAH